MGSEHTTPGAVSNVPPHVTYTEADFDRLSWHDCHVWGLELRAGDSGAGDWTSDLALDVDFIAEWICGLGGGAQFRVAPASLVFHGVTDLEVSIDWRRAGTPIAVHPVSIDTIVRERVPDQKVHLDRPYWRWTIRLNWPDGGAIALGAVGFTQTFDAEPVVTDTQCLPCQVRRRGATG